MYNGLRDEKLASPHGAARPCPTPCGLPSPGDGAPREPPFHAPVRGPGSSTRERNAGPGTPGDAGSRAGPLLRLMGRRASAGLAVSLLLPGTGLPREQAKQQVSEHPAAPSSSQRELGYPGEGILPQNDSVTPSLHRCLGSHTPEVTQGVGCWPSRGERAATQPSSQTLLAQAAGTSPRPGCSQHPGYFDHKSLGRDSPVCRPPSIAGTRPTSGGRTRTTRCYDNTNHPTTRQVPEESGA